MINDVQFMEKSLEKLNDELELVKDDELAQNQYF